MPRCKHYSNIRPSLLMHRWCDHSVFSQVYSMDSTKAVSVYTTHWAKRKRLPELNQPGRHKGYCCAQGHQECTQLGLLRHHTVPYAPAGICIHRYQCISGCWRPCKDVFPDVESVVPAGNHIGNFQTCKATVRPQARFVVLSGFPQRRHCSVLAWLIRGPAKINSQMQE